MKRLLLLCLLGASPGLPLAAQAQTPANQTYPDEKLLQRLSAYGQVLVAETQKLTAEPDDARALLLMQTMLRDLAPGFRQVGAEVTALPTARHEALRRRVEAESWFPEMMAQMKELTTGPFAQRAKANPQLAPAHAQLVAALFERRTHIGQPITH
ncbi:hypothetical protein [Hymenobacter latericus]|uniref:hypothetical protein n=1 Tax=Hymenobacter sp. YIM 151858-1 TaxID=2987688 RepID=UPI0022267BAB|nr:hypothetical protein [Hymenobacter sp. YIM 151858-1]UYZ59116.1 hypothetical protein OIS50_18915 [Hymenobacter sp. YIM 151858-1]